MAVFNPPIPNEQAQNMTGRSQGIGTSKVFSTLFGGIANAIEGYTKARDEQIQENIYKSTVNETESIQAPYIQALQNAAEGTTPTTVAPEANVPAPATFGIPGGASASGFPGQETTVDPTTTASTGMVTAGSVPVDMVNIPPGLKKGLDTVAKLQAGLAQGTAADYDYHLKLNTMLSGLRAQYPGYERQIDQTVQSVTGVTPGNALVADYFQMAQANAAKESTAANKWETYLKENEQYLGPSGHADAYTNAGAYADPAAQARLKSDVATVKGEDANNDRKLKAVQLNDSLNKNVETEAYDAAASRATSQGRLAVKAAMNANPQLMMKIQKAVQDPKSMTPEDLASITSGINDLVLQSSQAFDAWMTEPVFEGGGSLQSKIKDATKYKTLQEMALAPIRQIQQAIDNEQYGVASAAARNNKQTLEHDKQWLTEKYPIFRLMQGVNELGGQAATNQLLSEGSPAANEWIGTLQDIGKLGAVGGGAGGGPTSADGFARTVIENAPKDAPQVLLNNAKDAVNIIINPKSPQGYSENAIKYLFGEGNSKYLENFDEGAKNKMFSLLVNPTTAKRILDLSQSGNPELWQNFSEWSKLQFAGRFRAAVQRVQSGTQEAFSKTYAYNPTTGQFSSSPVPGGSARSSALGRGLVPELGEPGVTGEADKAVNSLNQIIPSMMELYKIEGLDPSAEVLKQLQTMGYNPGAPKTGNWMDQLGAAVVGFVTDTAGVLGQNLVNPQSGIDRMMRENSPIQPDAPLNQMFAPTPNSSSSAPASTQAPAPAPGQPIPNRLQPPQSGLDPQTLNSIPPGNGVIDPATGKPPVPGTTTAAFGQASTVPASWNPKLNQTGPTDWDTFINQFPEGAQALQQVAAVKPGEKAPEALRATMTPGNAPQVVYKATDPLFGNTTKSVANAVSAVSAITGGKVAPIAPSGVPITQIRGDSPVAVAKQFLGENETENAAVIAEFIQSASGIKINPKDTAWCAAWANAILASSGNKQDRGEGKGGKGVGNGLWAMDFEGYGTDARDNPQEGDVTVFRWKDGGGHVGFYMGQSDDGKYVYVLGGNQDTSQAHHGQVSIARFPAANISAIRHPVKATNQQLAGNFEDRVNAAANPTAKAPTGNPMDRNLPPTPRSGVLKPGEPVKPAPVNFGRLADAGAEMMQGQAGVTPEQTQVAALTIPKGQEKLYESELKQYEKIIEDMNKGGKRVPDSMIKRRQELRSALGKTA